MKNYKKEKRKKLGIHDRKKALDSIKALMERNPRKAKSELLHELESHPYDMYCWFYYGQICQMEGELDEAEYAYTKVAESKSWNKYGGIVGLADIARIKGDSQKAKRLYRQAIEENPEEKRATYYTLSKLEMATGNYEEAIRVLEQLDSNCSETQLEKVRVYIEAEKFEEAEKLIATITPGTPKEEREFAFAKAKLAIHNNDVEAAKYYFMKAKEYEKKDARYYNILSEEAKFALDLKEYQLAVDNCEEAIRANQTAYGDNYWILGSAKRGLKQYRSAMDCFSAGINEPLISKHQKASCGYWLASLQMLMNDLDAAEKTLKICLDPNSPRQSVIDLLINVYIRQGKYEQARKLISDVSTKFENKSELDKLEYFDLIISKKMGEITPNQRHMGNSYREKQVIDYHKQDAIIHIINHHQLGDLSESYFPKDADIEKIYDEVRARLTDDNRVVIDAMDRYVIEYQNAGYTLNGDIVHRIGVVTIPGTKDIITMYPEVDDKTTGKDLTRELGHQKSISPETDRIKRFNARFAMQPKN